MARTSKQEVEQVFENFCRINGVKIGHGVGEWSIDNAPVYGGWQMAIHGANGAIIKHIGTGRMTSSAFVAAMHMAIDVVRERNNR